MSQLTVLPDTTSIQVPLLQTQNEVEERQSLYRRLVRFFFLHTPDISFELNEKYRWKNVYTFITMMSLLSIILNLSNGSMFDAYTFLIFGDKNAWVGYLSGASGLATLILAFPIGVFVDIWNRALVTKIASAMLILCAIFGTIGIGLKSTTFLFLFTISLKVSFELCISSGNTLFSDSLSMKDRTRYLSYSSTASSICQSVGPTISLAYFLLIKDEWDVDSLRLLLFVATIVFLPTMGIVTSRFYNINPHLIKPDAPEQNSSSNTNTIDDDTPTFNLMKANASTYSVSESTMDSSSEIDTHTVNKTFEDFRFEQMTRLNRLTPGFVLASSITRSFGTGMLIKYLPLFFKQDFNFSPIAVNILLVLQALSIATMIQVGLRVSYKIGRPVVSLFLSVVSSLALFGLTYITSRNWAIFFFVIRTALQNAITPIDQSIIMDYTRSKHRGKWNSGFSFTQFLWSGSAFFGGFISDSNGYRTNFLITTIFYLLACIVYIPVLWMVIPNDLPRFLRQRRQPNEISEDLKFPLNPSK